MQERSVEQLLHGYRRGHEQLASSVKLEACDADLITRLSDVSGSLAGAPKFSSYLTIYPLPSGRYFALARTWPDPDAARLGCVLTHTLLVPVPVWATLEEPYVLNNLFLRPISRSTHDYDYAVAIPEILSPAPYSLKDADHKRLLLFVSSFFCEGRTPIVWFEQDRPEDVLWSLLRGLWPKLRSIFSACTFCLQPRTLEGRPFELMFAPAEVYPRFQKIRANHFIDATISHFGDDRTDRIEPWCALLEKQLFSTAGSGFTQTDPDLWAELDEDPAAVRRLFLIQKIAEDGEPAPQVFVGAMDLVESLAKSRDSAIASKLRTAERAVRAARETDDPSDGLESLHLIEDRLRRISFSRVRSEIGPVLLDSAAMITRKFPEITAQYIGRSPTEPDLQDSWLGRGLLQGFQMLAHDDPEKLFALRNAPAVVRYFLTVEPKLGASFIRSTAAQRSDRNTRAALLQWLEEVRDPEIRRALRVLLVPELNSDDTDILAELLKGLQAEEVGSLLDVLWRQTNNFETPEIIDLLIGEFAHGYPGETRDWTFRLLRWTPDVARIFASTYPLTRQGIIELLDKNDRADCGERAEAVAAFLQRLGQDYLPYWLIEVAHERVSLLSTLLEATASESCIVTEQTQRLLSQIEGLPFVHWLSLHQKILDCSEQPFFLRLRDLAMHSLIPGYVEGAIGQSAVRAFQENQAIVSWFDNVEFQDLKSLLVHGGSSSSSFWINAWEWAAIAPTSFYARDPTLLRELISMLSRSHGLKWTSQISELWSEVIRRARSQPSSERTVVLLCVQALRFSFGNTQLPLGPLVAEAFNDVYAAVTSSTFTLETAPLFGMFDWDKGKDLRRELVDCFIRSKWPPAYLAFAAAEVSLLRKVFKRIMKTKGGERYAKSVLADLEKQSSQNATTLAKAMRHMLAHPDFDEDWV